MTNLNFLKKEIAAMKDESTERSHYAGRPQTYSTAYRDRVMAAARACEEELATKRRRAHIDSLLPKGLKRSAGEVICDSSF